MLTLPTKFQNAVDREGEFLVWIVKVDNGTTARYFGSTEFYLATDGVFVEGRLRSTIRISQASDPFSRRSSIGNVTLRLVNAGLDGDRKLLSEYWTELWADLAKSGTVSIYAAAGPIDSLSEALLVFQGVLRKDITWDDQFIQLDLEDIGAPLLRAEVPPTRVNDVDAGLATETDWRLPIINGLYVGTDPWKGRRWAATGPLQIAGYYWLADHKIDRLGEIYFQEPHSGLWMILDQSAMGISLVHQTAGGVTRTYVNIPTVNVRGWFIIPPRGLEDADFVGASNRADFNPGMNDLRDPDHAWDQRDDTLAGLYVGNDSGAKVQACFAFNNIDADPGWTYDNTKNYLHWRVQEVSGVILDYPDTGTTGVFGSNVVVTADAVTSDLVVDGSGIFDGTEQTLQLYAAYPSGGWDDYIGNSSWALDDDNFRVRILAHAVSGSYNILPLCEIAQVQLRIWVNLNIAWQYSKWRPSWEVDGGMFGADIATRTSWADTSPNIYAGYIVERLLRQSFGLASAQVDVDSFDDAFNHYIELRTFITDDRRVRLDRLLQELGENSNVGIFFNVSGKVRAVDYFKNPTGVTVDATILAEDLAGAPRWEHTELDKIVTRLDFNFDYWPADDEYKTSEVVDAPSGNQADYGVRPADARFDYYTGKDPAGDRLDYFLAGHADAFLARPHDLVTFTTRGARKIEVEIGDWVTLDASVDNLVPAKGGNSWSTYKWLIISKTITEKGTELVGFALYDHP